MDEGSHRKGKAHVPLGHPTQALESSTLVAGSSRPSSAYVTNAFSLQSSQVLVIPTVENTKAFVQNHVPSIPQGNHKAITIVEGFWSLKEKVRGQNVTGNG
ncbi:hypothetical protein V6N13_133895 [Hibiscus sabdariffa]